MERTAQQGRPKKTEGRAREGTINTQGDALEIERQRRAFGKAGRNRKELRVEMEQDRRERNIAFKTETDEEIPSQRVINSMLFQAIELCLISTLQQV